MGKNYYCLYNLFHGGVVQLNQKTMIILFIIICTLGIFTTTVSAEATNGSSFFSFDSMVEASYDVSVLNETLEIGQTVTLPVNLRYTTEVPANFLRFFPKVVKNFLLYGATDVPQQTIIVEITQFPDWLNITAENLSFTTTMPSQNTPSELETTLDITPLSIPNPKNYEITLTVTSESIGRINGLNKEIEMQFTPSFSPRGVINTDQEKTIKLSYENDTKTSFQIESKANTLTRVTPYIEEVPANISISFYPKYQDVYWEKTATFYMELIPDGGFKNNASINISATLQSYPLANFPSVDITEPLIYTLDAPPAEQEGLTLNPFLILSIILIGIIIVLVLYGRKKQCW